MNRADRRRRDKQRGRLGKPGARRGVLAVRRIAETERIVYIPFGADRYHPEAEHAALIARTQPLERGRVDALTETAAAAFLPRCGECEIRYREHHADEYR